jgi:hypothetical protein
MGQAKISKRAGRIDYPFQYLLLALPKPHHMSFVLMINIVTVILYPVQHKGFYLIVDRR